MAKRPARLLVGGGSGGRLGFLGGGGVAEGEILEPDLTQHLVGAQLHRVGILDDVDRQIQVLEDAVEQSQRGLHLGPHPQQRLDREQQPDLQRGEGDDGADRDGVAEERLPGQPVDDRRLDGEGHLDG